MKGNIPVHLNEENLSKLMNYCTKEYLRMQHEIILIIQIHVIDLIEFTIKRTLCCRTRNQPRKSVTFLRVIKLYPVINVFESCKGIVSQQLSTDKSIYKAKTKNRNNFNTLDSAIRNLNLILRKLTRGVWYVYIFTFLYFNILARRWLHKLKRVARITVNKSFY
jgi:hypothetical protein